MRGGERVLERLVRLFPDCDIFTHVYVPEAVSPLIRSRPVRTTFINRLPGAARFYQKYLPLMPRALEQLDLRGYDLVISSESGPAKGVIAAPDAYHLCYCHSPMRYLWDHYHDYLETSGWLARQAIPHLFRGVRDWDVLSATRVDKILANSHFIQRRIHRAWGRDSTVVHPPVDVDQFAPVTEIEPHYLWISKMTPYKHGDIAVEAFNALGLPLLMVGDGEMLNDLQRRAGPNIRFASKLDFETLRRTYATARGLVFTAEEDFGIVPVEMMASGRPVLAYGAGGALDTVVPGTSGLFFDEQTKDSLIEGVRAMESWLPSFQPAAARAHAMKFVPERFDEGVLAALPQ